MACRVITYGDPAGRIFLSCTHRKAQAIRIHHECEGRIEKNVSPESPFGITRLGLNNIYSDKVHDIHKYNVKIVGSDSKPVAYLDHLLDMFSPVNLLENLTKPQTNSFRKGF